MDKRNFVFPFGDIDHNQQILAGLEALRCSGEFKFSYSYDYEKEFHVKKLEEFNSLHHIVAVYISTGELLIFDTHDSDVVNFELYEKSSLYFKRSYDVGVHGQLDKVCPLGLNYGAGPSKANLDSLIRAVRLSRHPKGMIRGIMRAMRMPIPYRFEPATRLKNRIQLGEAPRVLFLARTWNPRDHKGRSEYQIQQRQLINDMRAQCVRALRDEFGDKFTGGLIRDEFSLKNYSDFLAPSGLRTDRKSFLRLMLKHQICVSTTGLHDSTGWKLAEYVGAGRAIVTEKMRFQVPPPFSEGTNFLSFASAEECVERCRYLMGEKTTRFGMMAANRAYYAGYVEPKALMRNALYTAIALI